MSLQLVKLLVNENHYQNIYYFRATKKIGNLLITYYLLLHQNQKFENETALGYWGKKLIDY